MVSDFGLYIIVDTSLAGRTVVVTMDTMRGDTEAAINKETGVTKVI